MFAPTRLDGALIVVARTSPEIPTNVAINNIFFMQCL
jgi:hypothetical protein